jgi:hypothetical protein
VCKNLKIDGGFDRDTFTNIKYAINWNINHDCFKDSIVCTSGCKYWNVSFDPDDKDDTYMTLTQSSKEQFLRYGIAPGEDDGNYCVIFYYIVNDFQVYSVAAVLPSQGARD